MAALDNLVNVQLMWQSGIDAPIYRHFGAIHFKSAAKFFL